MPSPHRKIKLLHIIGTFLKGGTEQLMLDILSRLERETFDIIACAYGNQQLESVVQAYQGAGIRTITFPQESGLRLVRGLSRYIRQNRFDIVHTHHYQANTYCRPAATLARTPVVMTYQHNWPGRERARHRLLFRFLNRWTHKNVVVSESIRRYYLDDMAIAPDKVMTVHNGVNTTRFRPYTGDRTLKLKAYLEIPAESLVVGAAGRLVRWKRTDLLMNAAPKIAGVHPQTYFLVVGDGEMREQWIRLGRRLGVGDRVRFLGWRSDMPRIYRAMDIFCMVSESGTNRFSGEGFGLVSAEAMASGLPIVAVDNPVNREVITGACGLFCQSAPGDIARKVNQLIADPELRIKLAQAGRNRALSHFDIQLTVQTLSEIYIKAMRNCGTSDAC